MDSVWRKTAALPRFEKLEGDVKTDVLIIGGGITGILCAYFLKERGIDYLLVEGQEICHGVTGILRPRLQPSMDWFMRK